MPVLQIYKKRLAKFIEKEFSEEELSNLLFNLKSESRTIDNQLLEVEVNSDRPDLYISEGLGRAIKGLLGKKKGLFEPNTLIDNIEVLAEYVPSRPQIVIATIRGISLDDEDIKELIQFQEKLHLTVGRKRKKMAIGIHDLDKIPDRKITYKLASLNEKMRPLFIGRNMEIREVLKSTEQGISYGELSLYNGSHPAIYSGNEIISLPPVINSDITRIEPGTKNLLIDITGNDFYTISSTLNLITSVLNENHGSIIGKVEIVYSNGNEERKVLTPTLERKQIRIETEYIIKNLGFELSLNDITELLEKMRFKVASVSEDSINVIVPEYRMDILHKVDLVEDIAMAYGYNSIPLDFKYTPLDGRISDLTVVEKIIREVSTGLGFQEILGFILSGDDASKFIGENEEVIRVKNPVTETMKIIRPSIIPSLLYAIKESQHLQLPIKIFEIGECGYASGGIPITENKAGYAIVNEGASFEEMQSHIYSLLEILKLKPISKREEKSFLIKGRSASLFIEKERIGYIGEVHPRILEMFGVKYPVVVAELCIDKLKEKMEL
ncbi:phenylalanine--tRNA ligase subunit beta [Fervidicoccus fontis]|uniref:phenylalanine--tRNA ligase n=1 Tax=Fervidicoccus fontis (strain DSM 19380 / JCM 18336 / VKM B-2539 / Kam940) TaxID=1163730 RepID=H9ZZU0_FERFK|nr:phenylalanine--tRNA ligase subunit beta [Fervidicoccus fontis]AFH42247.1 phenylalanyl-tRNA synthetase subunit beta [Fervidicoccus fontis Kam940]